MLVLLGPSAGKARCCTNLLERRYPVRHNIAGKRHFDFNNLDHDLM